MNSCNKCRFDTFLDVILVYALFYSQFCNIILAPLYQQFPLCAIGEHMKGNYGKTDSFDNQIFMVHSL